MPLKVKNTSRDYQKNGAVDWTALRNAILASVDVVQEYKELGVKFSANGSSVSAWKECHAINRPDDHPSAAVHVQSGHYKDLGGDGESLDFFKFSLRYGRYGSIKEVFAHYAEKVGIDFRPGRPNSRGGLLERIYEYRNAQDEIAYGVFRFILPDGKKETPTYPIRQGSWYKEKGAMEGIAPLPYRLPDILSSNEDDAILVVEGEKDVDRAFEEGWIATTSHGGANRTDLTWPQFLHLLPYRDYYVIPDNDVGGKEHAKKVANLLLPIAKSVRIVVLPNLPKKGDLSDYYDLGGTTDELAKIIHATSLWTAESTLLGGRPTRLATAYDLIQLGQMTEYIWDKWLPKGVLILLGADPSIGKTRLCLDLTRIVANGENWPDGTKNFLPIGSRTLWVPADTQHKEIADCVQAYGIDPWLLCLNTNFDDVFSGTELESAEQFQEFEQNILEAKPAIVFIDTVNMVSDYVSHDTSDAKKLYKPLQEIAQRTNIPIVCVTHLGESGGVIGRRANEKARVTMKLTRPDPNDLRLRLEVTHTRLSTKPPPLGITMRSNGNTYDTTPPEEAQEGEWRGRPTGEAQLKANAWMRDFLEARPAAARAKEIIEAAKDAQILTPETKGVSRVYRALEAIHAEKYQGVGELYEVWRLPVPPAEENDEGKAF